MLMLKPLETVTIYEGSVPRSYNFCMTGTVPEDAKFNVIVNNNHVGVITRRLNYIWVNGISIRLQNVGPKVQGYHVAEF